MAKSELRSGKREEKEGVYIGEGGNRRQCKHVMAREEGVCLVGLGGDEGSHCMKTKNMNG